MGHYTPDWIHIYSKWLFFIPPAIAFALTGVLAVGFFLFRKKFRNRRWISSLVLVLCVLLTGYLLFRALGYQMMSISATDYFLDGQKPEGLVEEIERRTDLKLPRNSEIQAAVRMGWREYNRWYAVRGGTEDIVSTMRKLGYEERRSYTSNRVDRLPVPIQNWIKISGFNPVLGFTKIDSAFDHSAAIDIDKDLAIIQSGDH